MTTEAASALARSDLSGPGYRRRRCGRGFRYFAPDSAPVTDPATVARLKGLVIPPAWADVWICPDPEGHVQEHVRCGRTQLTFEYRAKGAIQREQSVVDEQVCAVIRSLKRRPPSRAPPTSTRASSSATRTA